MASRKPFYLLVGLLFIAGITLTLHRHYTFDIPWLPGENRQTWSIEAKVEFEANGKEILASLAIPDTQPGFTRLNQQTASPGFGLSFVESEDGGQHAEWSIRKAKGAQTLYYKVDMLLDPYAIPPHPSQPPPLKVKVEKEPYATAASQLLERARERSANPYTLARELILEFKNQTQNAELLAQLKSRASWIVQLLHQAGVPARHVHALFLEDGRRQQELVDYLQVFNGEDYELFNLETGKRGRPDNLLLWEYHSGPVLEVVGGTNSSVTFSMIEQEQPFSVALNQKFADNELLNFSIYTLPLEEQALFKGILLIPVGVLMVVLMRILIGIKTSGTFMPVLIAMAFIQTSLITGLVGFLLIVGTGLMIRSYLSYLNLLLVARISAVIIMVIGIIALFSIVAYKVGLTEGMKVTFFPMIILAWTIERMSILWEEEGPHEVLIQGGGSLLVAVLAYLAMNNDLIRHLTFNFLGIQLVLMALVLMAGNYTGYRLLELKRFKPMTEDNQ
ncbi:inactive transglutaminase family protein [Methylophaga sp. OBS4]|uniref:inactive transglutaminase family protein n=1 Tax=Methylophaga sp. OBS4 TaxID=2991935 RepID=UPI002254985B|nr:inactive transglutaminase family protein [Methylophaga sp. OBS4]MCX4186711.1 inactive transglutaminase family protein [Methylophaga sp. OBS4]